MSKEHSIRFGWVGALFAVMLLAAGCSKGPDIDPHTAVPADAKGVAYFNVKQLAREGLVDKIIKADKEEGRGQIANLLKATKVDPKKDLDAVTIVMGDSPADRVLIATGRFDEEAIYALSERPGVEEVLYKKHRLLRAGEGRIICVVEGGILLAGEEKMAYKVLDILKGDAQPMGQDSPLLAGVKDLSGRTMWLTMGLDGLARAGGDALLVKLPIPVPSFDVSELKMVTVGANAAGKAIELTATVGCSDEDAANSLQACLQGVIGMITSKTAAMKKSEPEAARLVEEFAQSVKVESNGESITVEMNISLALVEALQESRRKAHLALCLAQLEPLAVGCQYYVMDKGKSMYYPRSLQELVGAGIVSARGIICPADNAGKTKDHSSYEGVFSLTEEQLPITAVANDAMFVWDSHPRHNGKRCVIFADRHVEVLDEAEFQNRLQAVKAALAKAKSAK